MYGCFIFCAVGALCVFSCFSKVMVTEWPHIGKIDAHSVYEMFSWYEYLIDVFVFFPTSGLWSGNLFSDCAFS